MQAKDYYFFFKNSMPIAVFLTPYKGEAMELFERLYGQSWTESVKAGITVAKEEDVGFEKWQEIHEKYKAIESLKSKISDKKRLIEFKASQGKLVQAKSVLPKCRPVEYSGSTILETAKYLR